MSDLTCQLHERNASTALATAEASTSDTPIDLAPSTAPSTETTAVDTTPPPPSPKPPKGWPSNVKFITNYVIDPSLNLPFLPPVTQSQIARHKLQSLNPKPYASPHAHIQLITDPKHPACGQNGLFASRDLGYNTHIVDYIGQVISADSEQIKTSDYVLDFGGGGEGCVVLSDDGCKEIRLAVDGEHVGNEGRMVNDFRGVPFVPEYSERKTFNSKQKKVSSNPEYAMYANKSKANVEFRSYVNIRGDGEGSEEHGGEMRMGLFVCNAEGVKKGKELLISYGKGYWASRGLDLGGMYSELDKI
ncbi:UNVERIFIED_CONTAM: hypothetical protein HDU68_003811 [Siphonaria sp. JEL0065]|nr:hypothetical protein HDU68_003811 [Siphonaria sp. JEL0065]